MLVYTRYIYCQTSPLLWIRLCLPCDAYGSLPHAPCMLRPLRPSVSNVCSTLKPPRCYKTLLILWWAWIRIPIIRLWLWTKGSLNHLPQGCIAMRFTKSCTEMCGPQWYIQVHTSITSFTLNLLNTEYIITYTKYVLSYTKYMQHILGIWHKPLETWQPAVLGKPSMRRPYTLIYGCISRLMYWSISSYIWSMQDSPWKPGHMT